MESQDFGLIVLPVILLLAFLINYFDQDLKAPGERLSTDSHDDTPSSH